MPSLAMIGTITSPATGSAHHHPATAFRSKPPKRIADRYVQKSVCRESAFIAPLPIPAATRRLALASNPPTTNDRETLDLGAGIVSGNLERYAALSVAPVVAAHETPRSGVVRPNDVTGTSGSPGSSYPWVAR